MTTDELLCFIAGGLTGVLAMAVLEVLSVFSFRDIALRFKKRPGLFTWRRLDDEEEEVVLEDGRAFRGEGLIWHQYPHGTLAPDWLAKWLSEQARAAKMMHAVGTGRKRFMLEARLQKRRERRHYGDN